MREGGILFLRLYGKKMCSGRNGGWGKGFVRDQLGVIAQMARLRLCLWLQPRCRAICGFIPVRKSRKEMSLGLYDKRALVVVGAGLVSMTVATFYSGNAAAKFAKICGFE